MYIGYSHIGTIYDYRILCYEKDYNKYKMYNRSSMSVLYILLFL